MVSFNEDKMVDQNELRVMQACVMAILMIGFVIDSWEVIAVQVGIFFLTIMSPVLNPFIAMYRYFFRPLGFITADWREDNMEPHRFASIIGFSVSSAATYFLYIDKATLGWSLVWLIEVFGVFALSGWCAGCFTYYMIQKSGIKGFFKKAPITGSFPGTRPPKSK